MVFLFFFFFPPRTFVAAPVNGGGSHCRGAETRRGGAVAHSRARAVVGRCEGAGGRAGGASSDRLVAAVGDGWWNVLENVDLHHAGARAGPVVGSDSGRVLAGEERGPWATVGGVRESGRAAVGHVDVGRRRDS